MRLRDWVGDALGVILLFGILYGVLFLGAVVAP